MEISQQDSGEQYRICPLCEACRLVFDGWLSAQCPACGCEPGSAILKTLHEIVSLPEHRNHQRPGSNESTRT